MSPVDDGNLTRQANRAPHENNSFSRYAFFLACLAITASILSNNGVCIAEARFLSDLDYFKGAIDSVIHDPVDGVMEEVPGKIISKLIHSQRYSNANEFLNENPNCCKFVSANSGDGGPEISFLDRLRGVHTVQVSYDKRYTDEMGAPKSAGVMGKVAVTSCGTGRPVR